MSTRLNSQRLFDPVLTQFAFGYQNSAMVAESLLPPVEVESEKGLYPVFGKESFKTYNSLRSLGAQTQVLDISASTRNYLLDEHSLEAVVDDREVQESHWPIHVEQGKLLAIMETLSLEKEFAVASMVQDDSHYGANHKLILDGSTGKKHWNGTGTDEGDPIGDIQKAKEQIRSATGRYPNVLLLGAKSYTILKEHQEIVERIKYTQAGVVTPQLLSHLLDIETVQIGRAVYANADGEFQDVWEDNAILAVAEKGLFIPSFGHILHRKDYPRVTRYRDESRKSTVISPSLLYRPVYCSWEAAFLIKHTVG